MNNPIKGAVLKNEPATVKFRGEEYCYTYYYSLLIFYGIIIM